jgi:adenylate cyclase
MKNFLKRVLSLTPFKMSVLMVIGLVFLYILAPRSIDILELKALDLRFFIRGPVKPGPDVVIAVIDEKSVDEIGRWPWPRSRIAELITKLSRDGAKSIGFDVGFFEPDENTNIKLIDRLSGEINRLGLHDATLESIFKQERDLADNDLILAEAIRESSTPVVLGYFFHITQDESVAHISPEQIKDKLNNVINGNYSFVRMSSPDLELGEGTFFNAFLPESNIPLLAQTAQASGYFNMFPDVDGTVRWVPMAIQCRDKYYQPLSLQALRFFLGNVPASLSVTDIGVETISVGSYKLPTDEMGRLLVNYRGPAQTFPHYPIADILADRCAPGTFQDKIVLVGATAVGIYDLRVTPFDSIFPGIEIHANVLDNILQQDFLVRPGWVAVLDLAAVVIIGLFLGLVLPHFSAIIGPLLGIGLTGVLSVANYIMFTRGLWINFTYPLLTLILVYSAITVFRYVTEEREKKKIKGAFSYYVNPSVVTEMLKNPDMLKLGGDKRIMTVLFSDIRNFTTISERLEPEALVHLLNQYLTVMTDLVFKYDGLVDKYIGDAVMAVWGAPLVQPNHAMLACRSSLEMMAALEDLRKKWAAEDPNIPFIDIGIGLNSGPMVVGNMGSQTRFDYTVMGDAVNLGSRLEGANKQYGTHIIIGEVTYAQVNEALCCRELDSVAVKGKERPVCVYELLGEVGQIPEEKLRLARAFHQGLFAYKNRQWDRAYSIFTALKGYYPEDKPTELYLERIRELKKSPPPADWDGVFVMKTK